MAWPSGTKASTTNVDAGTDSITSARADIKQNIDNVNEIITHLNISSPNNGDLLQYSTSSSKWEQVAATSIGSQTKFAVFKLEPTSEENVAGNIYRRLLTIQLDPNNIIDTDSTGDFTFNLSAGTYIVMPMNIIDDDTIASPTLHNDTDDAQILTGNWDEIGNAGQSLLEFVNPTFTLAGTKSCSWRMNSAVSGDRIYSGTHLLIKI
tara:strand:- start:60 stop:680 length:621 start_codon:yes stop_codon:yes gene_type:complete